VPNGIGPLQDHVADDRPAHIVGEVVEGFVEPVLGERAADGARVECHGPTVA
jgi:hypothetical protein